MSRLLTAAEVGEMLGGLTAERVRRMTVTYKWPCVRLSGKTIRYRPEHVEQIIAANEDRSQIRTPERPSLRDGQTSRSKGRTR